MLQIGFWFRGEEKRYRGGSAQQEWRRCGTESSLSSGGELRSGVTGGLIKSLWSAQPLPPCEDSLGGSEWGSGATPILTAPLPESSLTDLLVRKPASSKHGAAPLLLLACFLVVFRCLFACVIVLILCIRDEQCGTLNPQKILELFSMYRDWQEDKVQKISSTQEEIENKIEVVDALAVKLMQRFNGSVSTMKTASQHLSEG
ncbi:hypothetical protein KSS87_019106 [Heliosperma pusillum]|nr:hypothetical protein KSS87_019106 [Heliosperma pusillum]